MKTKVKCWQCDKENKIEIMEYTDKTYYILYPFVEWKCECGFNHNAYNTKNKKNETSIDVYNYHKLYEEDLTIYDDSLEYAIKVLESKYKRTKNEHKRWEISIRISTLEDLKYALEL